MFFTYVHVGVNAGLECGHYDRSLCLATHVRTAIGLVARSCDPGIGFNRGPERGVVWILIGRRCQDTNIDLAVVVDKIVEHICGCGIPDADIKVCGVEVVNFKLFHVEA